MSRSQNSFIKNQKANKKRKARQEKLQRKIDKKDQDSSGKLDDMIAYIDANGNIVDENPKEEYSLCDLTVGQIALLSLMIIASVDIFDSFKQLS